MDWLAFVDGAVCTLVYTICVVGTVCTLVFTIVWVVQYAHWCIPFVCTVQYAHWYIPFVWMDGVVCTLVHTICVNTILSSWIHTQEWGSRPCADLKYSFPLFPQCLPCQPPHWALGHRAVSRC